MLLSWYIPASDSMAEERSTMGQQEISSVRVQIKIRHDIWAFSDKLLKKKGTLTH